MFRKLKKIVRMDEVDSNGDEKNGKEEAKGLSSSDFDYLETIGYLGKYGPVFKVKKKETNEIFALRMAVIKDNEKEMTRYWKETMYQYKYLEHEKIVKYYEVWTETPTNTEWYYDMGIYPHVLPMQHSFVQMEYFSRGNLALFMKESHSFHKLEKLFGDIVEGLEYLHGEFVDESNTIIKKKMVHRNLTPQNIFISEKEDGQLVAKIGDFGNANMIREKMTSGIGASFYMSPEMARGNFYDEKTDIFSTGVIFFQMLQCVERGMYFQLKPTGAKTPNSNPEDDVGTVAYGKMPQYFMETYKAQATLITMMIAHDPFKRPTATDILDRLRNPEKHAVDAIPPGSDAIFFDNYKDLKSLKSQRKEKTTTKCYKATRKDDGNIYAVKLTELTRPCTTAKARTDINILTHLDHPNLVKYNKTWLEHPKDTKNRWEYPDYTPFSKESKYIFIEMEYCDQGCLAKMQKKGIKLERAKEIFIQLVEGLAFLHTEDVIHRDLNPLNIFLKTKLKDGKEDGINAKIGCFQFARQPGRKMTIKGDLNSPYISPEQRESVIYGHKTDVYALGVIFYEMIFGSKDLKEMPKLKSTNEEYKSEIELIKWMTERDAEIRFSAAQVKAWVQKYYLKDIPNGNGTNGSIHHE